MTETSTRTIDRYTVSSPLYSKQQAIYITDDGFCACNKKTKQKNKKQKKKPKKQNKNKGDCKEFDHKQ